MCFSHYLLCSEGCSFVPSSCLLELLRRAHVPLGVSGLPFGVRRSIPRFILMLPVATLNWLESRYIADRPLGDQTIVPNCRPLRRRWGADVPCCVGATEASWVGAWGVWSGQRALTPPAVTCSRRPRPRRPTVAAPSQRSARVPASRSPRSSSERRRAPVQSCGRSHAAPV